MARKAAPVKKAVVQKARKPRTTYSKHQKEVWKKMALGMRVPESDENGVLSWKFVPQPIS
jgi:hypothetical protein